MQEQWKQIIVDEIVYDYEVSSHGQVRNMKTGRILKLTSRKDGYLCATLYKNKKHKVFLVHRLVAIMFLPNQNDLPQVNHINEDKTNNIITNLEWVSEKQNVNHGTRNERASNTLIQTLSQEQVKQKMRNAKQGKYNGKKNPNAHKVLCVETGKIFDTVQDACEWCGRKCVSQCCRGKQKTAGGYHWQYVD